MTTTTQYKNWAGNHTYQAARLHGPHTVEQVQDTVRRSGKVKALGTRHSFNAIADTEHDHLSLANLNQLVALDREARTVTVEAGMRYGDLCAILDHEGFALHNMASLPHISVAGSCATATHGSGDANGNLATAVAGMEIVTAEGDLLTVTRQDADFPGRVVHLGALGVVTKVTLDLLPRYEMRQDVYLRLPLAQIESHFEDIFSAAYSVSLFTTWQHDFVEQVWLKSRRSDGSAYWGRDTFYGAARATVPVSPIADAPVERCTPQLGIPGAWNERLPHFRLNFTPSFGEELQSEYFIPRPNAVEALGRIHALREIITPYLFISEVRTIAADDLWMSPCYGQACVGIHFTWKQHWGVRHILPLIESQLEPLGARPHWGKLFTLAPEIVQSRYEKLPAFRRLAQQVDPAGKFRNAFLDRYVLGV
ncbi:MAG: FAD-binding protein [bacterium]|nr:FAD-binding protein [bacterium]